MKNQKIIIQILLVCLVLGSILFYVFKKQPLSIGSMPYGAEQILDLKKESTKIDEGNRYQTLVYMTNTSPGFEQEPTYLLDDNDPSTRVLIGIYAADEYGKNGGIIMLKKLNDGRFAIFWEIKSPYFWEPGGSSLKKIEDVNKDGLKELIIPWRSALSTNHNQITDNWIITLDPKNKRYKVLNPVIDAAGTELSEDIDFEQMNPDKGYEKFQSNTLHGLENLLQDIDGDGIQEIVVTYKFEEGGPEKRSVYKFGDSKYYLWKETTEPVENEI